MSSTVGEVKVKLSFDTKTLTTQQSKVKRTVEKNWKSVAQNVGETLKTGVSAGFTAIANMAKATGKAIGVGLAAGTAGVVALTKSAVESFGEYEQLVGGVETLFKGSAGVVENYANQAYKTAQISANNYMETVTSFSASLLQSLNGDTAKSAEYANNAIIDMADNANKMGTSMESIQWAYQGFAKQNYTMLDNLKLGYGGTKSEMERLIADANKVKKANGEMANLSIDSFADVTEAIHIIQTQLGITGTSALEASTTIQGSFNSMKSSWQNMLTAMASGKGIDSVMDELIDSVSTFGKNVMPVIQKALEGIGTLVAELAPVIAENLPALMESVLPPLMEALISLLNAVITALPQILPTLLDAITQAITLIVQALPQILPTLMQGLVTMVQALCNQLPTLLPTFLQAIVSLIRAIVQNLPSILQSVIDAVVGFLSDPANISLMIEGALLLFGGIVQAIPQIIGGILQAFGALFGSLWSLMTEKFGQFVGALGNFLGNLFKQAINVVLGFLENIVNAPIDLLNGFIGVINDTFGWIGVNIGKINRIQLPRLAEGGVATGATTAIIGEAGKEAVIPLERNQGNWAGLLASTLVDALDDQGETLGGREIVVNNYINSEMDADDIGRRLMTSLRRSAL